jgi:hypothetical protein
VFLFEFEGKSPLVHPDAFVAGIPAKPTKPIAGASSEFWVESNPPYHQELAKRHAAGARAVGERS